ncbi:hypothetical protein [Pontibacter qinzhouensis]|nr:hypothetical protein [Pontibacter qinzhouensis]
MKNSRKISLSSAGTPIGAYGGSFVSDAFFIYGTAPGIITR